MENSKIDFVEMGKEFVKQNKPNAKEEAKRIGKVYGEQAKMEFESGIALANPIYSDTYRSETYTDEADIGSIVDSLERRI